MLVIAGSQLVAVFALEIDKQIPLRGDKERKGKGGGDTREDKKLNGVVKGRKGEHKCSLIGPGRAVGSKYEQKPVQIA